MTMQWAQAWALWLLLLVPIWWCWCQRRRRRPALRHPLVQFVIPHLPRTVSWRAQVRQGLWALVLVLLILALARPRWPDPLARLPTRSLAWLLVVDISGSMAEQDFVSGGRAVARWEVARQILQDLLVGGDQHLPGRQDDLIGLVTFAVFVQDLAPPTANHAALVQLLQQAEPISTPPESATNIGDALIIALRLLGHTRAPARRILLVSDGEHNVPPEILSGARHPLEAAQLARSLGIPIDTIRIGPEPQAVADVRLRQDAEIGQQIMRQVASITGGLALEASDAPALRRAVETWDALTRPVIERPDYYQFHEAYPYLGASAVLVLLLAIFWEWRIAPLVP
ncbi:MAG: VWA domain-containing protein [Gemmatales bacterium]|nr:VWA domain-containing protein [Gemmatales bacterium]MDW7993600.1 VWA domain-containing protein [Gemmatales bacterium]